jgi:hypothetical protein
MGLLTDFGLLLWAKIGMDPVFEGILEYVVIDFYTYPGPLSGEEIGGGKRYQWM